MFQSGRRGNINALEGRFGGGREGVTEKRLAARRRMYDRKQRDGHGQVCPLTLFFGMFPFF